MKFKITKDWVKSFFVIIMLLVITLGPTVDLVGRIIKTRRVVEKQGL